MVVGVGGVPRAVERVDQLHHATDRTGLGERRWCSRRWPAGLGGWPHVCPRQGRADPGVRPQGPDRLVQLPVEHLQPESVLTLLRQFGFQGLYLGVGKGWGLVGHRLNGNGPDHP